MNSNTTVTDLRDYGKELKNDGIFVDAGEMMLMAADEIECLTVAYSRMSEGAQDLEQECKSLAQFVVKRGYFTPEGYEYSGRRICYHCNEWKGSEHKIGCPVGLAERIMKWR